MKKGMLLLAGAVTGILMSAAVYGAEPQKPTAQEYDIKAYSAATSVNNEITYQNYGEGINEKSVYELASNGKTVDAYIALRLAEEGKLKLEEKIAPYLKSSLRTEDTRINEITLRQLLCHTAGFSPSFELGVDRKLYSDPGAQFRYSGVGYIYLQSVIENVSGMTLEQAAQYYVFGPLGMKNSTFENAKTVTPYMKLSAAVPYALAAFTAAFIVLFLIVSAAGRITKFRFYSFRSGMLSCIVLSGVINLLFLLFVFVSKVVPLLDKGIHGLKAQNLCPCVVTFNYSTALQGRKF